MNASDSFRVFTAERQRYESLGFVWLAQKYALLQGEAAAVILAGDNYFFAQR